MRSGPIAGEVHGLAARAPARHARGRRQLHHQASKGRAFRVGLAGGNGGIDLVATRGGPTMLARIGIMTALNRHVLREFNPDRKEPNWASGS
jgi:hypothetical protein